MRRVPLVILAPSDPTAVAFRALVDSLGGDLTGREGLSLEISAELGPEPSIVVDATTTPAPDTLADRRQAGMTAIGDGHALVTADLAPFTEDPVDLAVAIADRRVGLCAALLPGTALVPTLARLRDAGDRIEQVVITGAGPEQLAREAAVVSGLIGIELGIGRVQIGEPGTAGEPDEWWATITDDAFPRVDPVRTDESPATASHPGLRSARIRTVRLRSSMTLEGPPADPAVVSAALFADVLDLARQVDPPWRVHRRKVASFG